MLYTMLILHSPYMLGNHPTFVDFGFAGPFFRHFSSDFTARKIMQQQAPAVFEWVGRLWNAKASKFQMPSDFPSPGTVFSVFISNS